MPAIKLSGFGGMLPSQDDRLLPDNMASDASDVWLYAGTLEGIREPRIVYSVTNPATKRVFRIPKKFVDRDHIPDSWWLEFPYKDVDVLKSPVRGDSYTRYYWAGNADNGYFPPQYTTLSRVETSSTPFLLGVPAPANAPILTTTPGKYNFTAGAYNFVVTPGSAVIYDSLRYGVDADSYYNGLIPPGIPNLQYNLQGNRAVLKWKTTTAGVRVTISDTGQITKGVPTRTPNTIDPNSNTRVLTTRAYAYTWVSAYGEEGPPSPPAVLTAFEDESWYVRLTAPTTSDTTSRNLSKVRIYRTVTSAAGVASYFFVAELDISQLNYTDTNTDVTVSLNNELQSLYWTAPPVDLKGMQPMPNGFFIGFRDNEVWFSEQYHPHAWPVTYTLSVDYKIIGVGVVGQTAIICTESATYAATGLNPANMTLSRIANAEPCLSRGSIVSTPSGVLYASPNGLMIANASGVLNATEKLFTKDKWLNALKLDTLRAARIGNSYYAFGSVATGVFETSAFEPSAFEEIDYTGSYDGGLLDPTDQRMSFVRMTSTEAVMNMYNDPWTDEPFILREGDVHWITITADRPRREYTWKSKRFQMPNKRNLEAMKIYFDNPESLPSYGTIKIYADGRLAATKQLVKSGQMMRMPSGFRADFWQIEITSKIVIANIQMATSAIELANV